MKSEKKHMVLPVLASVVFMPAFFVAFCLLYDPFHIEEFYTFGTMSYSFHLTMLGCIILLTLIPTKIVLRFLTRSYNLSQGQFVMWYALELFLCACFMALYTYLFRQSEFNWFQALACCLKYSFLILCYPAALIALLQFKENKRKDGDEPEDEGNLVKLYDEHRRLKLTISPSSILYVRADSNYVSIQYLDSGKVKEYLLRCSLKSMEESLSKCGMTRCHRSYLVNPRHVSMLGKAADGFTYATIDTPESPKIPVSKQYCESLSELL